MLIWPSAYLFFEVSIQIHCPFFIRVLFIFLLLICKSSLCSPGRNSLSNTHFIRFWFKFFCFFFGYTSQYVGSQFRDQGQNPHPWHWKYRVLTTETPAKSLFLDLISLGSTHLEALNTRGIFRFLSGSFKMSHTLVIIITYFYCWK